MRADRGPKGRGPSKPPPMHPHARGPACGPAIRKESPVSAARKRVAVVGVGTMGSQAAWRLAARGAEVVGYDRFAPGHDRSAAGGETRDLPQRPLRGLPVCTAAPARRRPLGAAAAGDRPRTAPAHRMSAHGVRPSEQQMATVLESIAEHGLDHEVLDAETLAKRFPQYRIEDGDAVVLDRRAGFIRPELTVQTAARRAEQLGAGSTATPRCGRSTPSRRRRGDPHRRRQRALRRRRRHPRPLGQRPAARPAVGGGASAA